MLSIVTGAQCNAISTYQKNKFLKAVQLVLEYTYFSYNEKVYKQIFGTAIGSPLSAVIANIVLEKLEVDILQNLKPPIAFFKRYVNDCIVAAPAKTVEVKKIV